MTTSSHGESRKTLQGKCPTTREGPCVQSQVVILEMAREGAPDEPKSRTGSIKVGKYTMCLENDSWAERALG